MRSLACRWTQSRTSRRRRAKTFSKLEESQTAPLAETWPGDKPARQTRRLILSSPSNQQPCAAHQRAGKYRGEKKVYQCYLIILVARRRRQFKWAARECNKVATWTPDTWRLFDRRCRSRRPFGANSRVQVRYLSLASSVCFGVCLFIGLSLAETKQNENSNTIYPECRAQIPPPTTPTD